MNAADDRDLHFACLWATALAIAVALFDGGLVRTLLGLPMVLLIAGHAPLRALDVRTDTFGTHLLYAIGASFAVGILGGFVLHAVGRLTPGGWAMWYWAIAVASSVIAVRRERRRPMPPLPVMPAIGRIHVFAGVVAAGMTTGAYALAVHDEVVQQQFKYTEFWLLPQADAANFGLGIRSGEAKEMRFDVEVAVDGKPFARLDGIRLSPGQTWKRTIEAPLPGTPEKTKDPERDARDEALRLRFGLKTTGTVEQALREKFDLGATDRMEEALRARVGSDQADQIVQALRERAEEERAEIVPRKAEAKLYRAEDGRLYRHVTAVLPLQ